jgi:hypothetical protein
MTIRRTPQAEVSQHSREVGRMPVEMRYEQAVKQRESLVREKAQIEAELTALEARKRDETADLLKRHGNKSANVVGTMEIEARHRKAKAELIQRKLAVEVLLGDVKRHLKDKPRQPGTGQVSDKVVMLMRIEDLLKRVVELLEARQ